MRKKISLIRMAACPGENCSGHGECLNGTCFCEIEFEGEECRKTNSSYFVSLACIYLFVACVCFIQLLLSIVAEWKRLKVPGVIRALKITNQKLLYLVVCLASLIRASNFAYLDGGAEEGWTRSLMSAYYPLLLSGASLIVCFWAELFHLKDTKWEQRQFLSKSSLAFVMFNLISYSLLAAELITVNFLQASPELEKFYTHIFNGCYAVLLLIVVIFFLIYGIEVYFKVRGGFLHDEGVQMRPFVEETAHLFPTRTGKTEENLKKRVNVSQLHQSRLGLLSQALMLSAVVILLCSETFGYIWKSKVPIYSRNWHNLVFRILEVGVALWFPCVLWNCMSPEQLWILNPKKLLKVEGTRTKPRLSGFQDPLSERTNASSSPGDAECWICYDRERKDAGPMIQPCLCKGDVKMVHHDCLLKWLVESVSKVTTNTATTSPRMKCPVCNSDYNISSSGRVSVRKVMRSQAWLQSCAITCFMLSTLGLAILIANLVTNTLAKVLTVGIACLIIYVSVRFVCQKQIDAYQRAKVSAMSIESNVATISEAVVLTGSGSEGADCHTPTAL